jgi:hypothetical protein
MELTYDRLRHRSGLLKRANQIPASATGGPSQADRAANVATTIVRLFTVGFSLVQSG